ncbi:MAG: nuclear transport factor 2 family protein [Herbiconiux sp.]|uniref:nuclear transport factor 2 family protein n=1 Tax=Herbiconiux sp. TaxID=1871186 RepID=UPI0011F97EEB|nr:nuclear transport factor 2 family protein [Herbiconiux sp.]TAJ46495.1 MAG: nuclear transport factor 2 family protein [Herbiconiux sp.]
MPTVSDLLAANLHDVFGNRDAVSRRAAIEASFTPDVAFIDPEETVTGWDALEAKAAGLLDGAPADFVFADDGLAYVSADTGVQGWTFGPAGSPAARGVDIITVRDGRITELRTLLHE